MSDTAEEKREESPDVAAEDTASKPLDDAELEKAAGGVARSTGEDSRGLWQINVKPSEPEDTWGDLQSPNQRPTK